MANNRSRAWCFTLNNYSDNEYYQLVGHDETILTSTNIKYLIVGKEVGANLTPHLQGYIVFTNAVRLATCKALIPRAHWETRRGTHEQARAYCMKEFNYVERGTPPMSQEEKGEAGKQSIELRWKLAKEGKFEELPPEMIKTYEYIHRKAIQKKDLDKIENYWIVGPSGCGKSRYVRDNFPGFYDKRINKWWDGYNHEEVVLIDDIDDKHEFIAHDLKRWADRYAFSCEVKGGNLKAVRPKHVIVTSQYRIGQIFKDPEAESALRRRFHEVVWDAVDQCFKLNDKAFDVSFKPAETAEMDVSHEAPSLVNDSDLVDDYIDELMQEPIIEVQSQNSWVLNNEDIPDNFPGFL